MPCTVEEPLAGWVSLDLNALCLVRSGTQTCPLPSRYAYTRASRWLGGQCTGKSSPPHPSSCLLQQMPRAPPTRLHAGQSMEPPRQSTWRSVCTHSHRSGTNSFCQFSCLVSSDHEASGTVRARPPGPTVDTSIVCALHLPTGWQEQSGHHRR